MLAKKQRKSLKLSYQDIGLKIASYLKETGAPISTKKIYEILIDKYSYSLSYENLVSNILPKINQDTAINVEKVYRGYWQYRLR